MSLPAADYYEEHAAGLQQIAAEDYAHAREFVDRADRSNDAEDVAWFLWLAADRQNAASITAAQARYCLQRAARG